MQLPPLEVRAFERLLAFAPGDLLHRRVVLRGQWLAGNTVFLDNRQMQGRQGFTVVTPLQIEALDAVAELCKDPTFRLDMKLERGDMQFVNNYCVLHSRTAYEDHQEEGRKRHLLRLWLRTPAFEDFPSALRDRYQDMDKWRANPRAPSYNFVTMKEVTTH